MGVIASVASRRGRRLRVMKAPSSIFVAMLGVMAACAGARSPSTPAPGAAAEGTVASADGTPVFYRSLGAGEPAVVLVHGWGFSSELWSDAIGPLAQARRVVTVDLPGHGRSGGARAAWTVAAYVDDLRAVIDHLGVGRAILDGHSMSGPIVVEAAVRMP